MRELINFTNCEVNKLKWFGGANGNKISVHYNNADYMLKFPPKNNGNVGQNYVNSCISENIACEIFQSIGIKAQDTILGQYNGKIVVACKDFEVNGYKLKDFAFLKNTIIDSVQNGYGTELEDILKSIEEQQVLLPKVIKEFFFEMMIGDALLGNFDRHNGNWGFLINEKTGDIKLAPVYDCGSCLYPQINESKMKDVINNQLEIDNRIYVFPTSAIKENNKKINYFDFISSGKNEDCTIALKKISDNIGLKRINSIIDSTPYIGDTQKEFFKIMVKERKEKIIDKSLEQIKTIQCEEQEEYEQEL